MFIIYSLSTVWNWLKIFCEFIWNVLIISDSDFEDILELCILLFVMSILYGKSFYYLFNVYCLSLTSMISVSNFILALCFASKFRLLTLRYLYTLACIILLNNYIRLILIQVSASSHITFTFYLIWHYNREKLYSLLSRSCR